MLTKKLNTTERLQLSKTKPMERTLSDQWEEKSDMHKQDKIDSNEIWDKIAAACWQEENKENKRKNRNLRLWISYSAAAVAILLLLGVWMGKAMSDSYFVVSAPANGKMAWVLPDSSTIWLNANSKIKYPKNFSENRTVDLTGEAYFSVVKKVNAPFKVNFQGACVEVKGTEFNVQMHSSTAEITLFTGKIVFSSKDMKQKFEMQPSEQIVYDINTHKVSLSTIDTQEYDWRTTEYHFQNKPFGELIRFINRTYKVDIIVKDTLAEKELFTGNIRKTETLSDVLTKICISFNLQQKNEDNHHITLY